VRDRLRGTRSRIRALWFRHLGMAGVLFAGLGLGHFKAAGALSPEVMQFVKEFGLVLFVYSIGMQVGPGFASSLRRDGLKLNALAFGIILVGALLAALLCLLFGMDMAAAVGLFTGATTNTPALGASQEALRHVGDAVSETRRLLPGLAYAVAYPFGVLGIIISMNLIRRWYRVDTATELKAHEADQRADRVSLERMNLVVTNSNLDGLRISEIPVSANSGVIVSRRLPKDGQETHVACDDEIIRTGDTLLAVGTPSALRKYQLTVGHVSDRDLMEIAGPVGFRRVVVTNTKLVGKSLRQLALNHRLGVTVTRLTRADVEMPVTADLELRFGDILQIVGSNESLDRAAHELGNSIKDLGHTQLLPMFFGIALGVVIGSTPISLPGVPVPVKLGLAGGPLLAGLLLSRLGRLGPLLWHVPVNVTLLLREFGIALFLACVGLHAGGHFVGAVLSKQGLLWLVCGAGITMVPLLLAGHVARRWLKMNYVTLCGLISGSMTDPPALAFANRAVNSDAPNVAYAAVYPLTMVLRIVVAQLLVLLFVR
jgi:putative transport protein